MSENKVENLDTINVVRDKDYLKERGFVLSLPQIVFPSLSNMAHVGTRVVLATDPTFKEDTIIHKSDVYLPDNIVTIKGKVQVGKDEEVFAYYQLYLDSKRNPTNDPELYTLSEPSTVVSIFGDQDGFKLDNVVVTTPYVKEDLTITSGVNVLYNTAKFTISGFNVILGAGKHGYTTWTIRDTNNNVIFNRKNDKDNLTDIEFPLRWFDRNKLYIVEAKFITDTNGHSRYGKILFNREILENLYFKLSPILPFSSGQSMYYKIQYNSANINKVGVTIKEVIGDHEVIIYTRDDLDPVGFVEIPSKDFKVGATYKTYAYSKVNVNGELHKTPNTLQHTFIFEETILNNGSLSDEYPGRYTKLPDIVLGGSVTVSRELKNGIFVLGKNSRTGFALYAKYGNTIRDTGIEIPVPEDTVSSSYQLPYVNVLPMYNDLVAINYTIFLEGELYRASVWCFYKANLATHNFTLIDHKIFTDEYYSTAMSSSAVVLKNNSIYYIPARYRDPETKAPLELPMFRIRLVDNKVVRTKVVDRVIHNVYRNVTMCATGNKDKGQEELLILGGTSNDGTNNVTEGGVQIGVKQYTLLNYNIYKYNVGLSTLEVIGQLPTTFPATKYCLSVFYRGDGRYVIFNNSDTGPEAFNSRSYRIDFTALGTDNFFTEENNESGIDIPFRSTIVLRNGDYYRIAYREEEITNMLLYPRIRLAQYVDGSETMVKHLIVPVGKTITIENPYIYESITIEGDSEENTGVLVWNDVGHQRYFDYRYKIITRNTKVTQQEDQLTPKEYLVILDGVTYMVIN